MPLYQYTCDKCDKDFDEFLSLKEYKKEMSCPECNGVARKVFTLGGIQDDHPLWLDQSVRDQLQDTDSPHIPIETRTQYNQYLKDTGFIPCS